MSKQMKVQVYKLTHFSIFRLAVIAVLLCGFLYGFIKIKPDYYLYEVFQRVISDTSIVFLGAFITSWFVGNDFSNLTIQHEITIGYSRWSVLLVREITALLMAVIIQFVFCISIILGFCVKSGLFMDESGLAGFGSQDIFWFVTVLFQVLALESIVVLIIFICGRAVTAIISTVGFALVFCNVLPKYLQIRIFNLSCFCYAQSNSNDILVPSFVFAVITLAAAFIITYLIFMKKEIK